MVIMTISHSDKASKSICHTSVDQQVSKVPTFDLQRGKDSNEQSGSSQ